VTTPAVLRSGRHATAASPGPAAWNPAGLFPAAIAVVGATRADPLTPSEAEVMVSAHPRRRQEFALGRTCVRRALTELGLPPAPVLSLESGAPDWPPEVTGSIAHCAHGAVAAVAQRCRTAGLGIDVEEAGGVTADIVDLVCSPEEIAALQILPGGVPWWSTVVFSAKESVYKALWPSTRVFLEWSDVVVHLVPASSLFRARVRVPGQREPKDVEGRFALSPLHVWTGLTLTPPGSPGSAARGTHAQEAPHG
jgi:4'-phosphopantetheinyl transferase EntD